ncbi:solute carrier family 36 [Acrasis kona]|uniref:Solute carrier family 36 n=1 Tax=Acrasis kona TaxID=1008807 RepID=A0AAW2YWZ0_9EUKA
MTIEQESVVVEMNYDDIAETKPEVSKKSSSFEAFWNIIKTFAGAGTFALPWAIKQSGAITGIIGIIILALIGNYTMKLLVKVRKYVQNNSGYTPKELVPVEAFPKPESPISKPKGLYTYIDMGYEALGNPGAILIYFLLCTCNLGGCTVYLVFIGKLMNSMVPVLADRIWMLIAMAILIPISWIRNYKYMSIVSFLGIASLYTAAGSVVIYGFIERSHEMNWPWMYGSSSFINIKTLPLFFGVALFLFNNHTSVLPIEQNMENRRKYPMTLNFSYFFVAATNLIFAVLCFCFFGVGIEDDVTKNLPNDSYWVYAIKSLLCVELIFSYGVIMMPVTEAVVEKKILKDSNRSTWRYVILSAAFRTCVALVTLVVAEIFGGRFALVMSFIGGISPNALGFITPSLFYLIIMKGKYGWPTLVFNIMIMILGFVGMIWNSVLVIEELVTQIKNGTF